MAKYASIDLIAYARESGSRRSHVTETGLSESDGAKVWKDALGIPDLHLIPAMGTVSPKLTGNKTPMMLKADNQFHVAANDGESWKIISKNTRSRLFKLFPFERGFEANRLVNQTAAEMLNGEVRVINAGKTDGGLGYWITSKMPDYAIADEPTMRHLFTRSSADGSTPLFLSAVATLPVCANTLAMASAEAAMKGGKLKHMATSEEEFELRVTRMIEMLKSQIGYFEWYKNECEKLANVEATSEMVENLWANVLFPMPEVKVTAAPKFVDGAGNDLTIGAVQETREPLAIVRRNEARERYNEIVNAEFERRGANLLSLQNANTGFVQYGFRQSNTKTDAVEKAIDFDMGDGANLKVKAFNAIRSMAEIA